MLALFFYLLPLLCFLLFFLYLFFSIAELVSQSSCQSANNPFAKGASPFSANKRSGASFSDPNSRNSPNPMTPARVIRPLQTSVLSGSGKGYSVSKQKPVHAFSEMNYGSSAGDDIDRDRDRDRDREREREKERERERDSCNSSGGGGTGAGSNYRSRPAFNDKSPCPARNPFQSVVEESKSSVASTSSSRSLPSSPVFFPCSPSILSSPVAGSQRSGGDFDKDERCRDSGDSSAGAGTSASANASGALYKRSSALSGSGSGSNYMDITNGELAALKRKTLNNSSSIIHANSGSDVGSGLDCDGDYEGDDRRDTRLRQPYIEKRHINEIPHSTGRIRDTGHPNISRSFSVAGEDFDGEEPELDIIRSTPGSTKGHHHHHLQQLQQLTMQQDRTRATSSSGISNSSSSSSGSKPTLLKASIENLLASASSKRLVHSASNSRIRPSSSADLNPSFSARRRNTASRSPSRRIQAPGQPQSASVSGREDEENEGYGYGQRYDNSVSSSQRTLTSSASASSILPTRSLSQRSSGRAQNIPLQSSIEKNSVRGRSKDPVYRPTGSGSGSISSISKKDFVRIGPNQLDTGEDEEAEWRCMKCSSKNTNQFHCDSCATKRTAYSYAPGQQLQLQPQPILRAPPK
jgi:hypothetical protein